MKRQGLALLLAVAMLFGLLPTQAFALVGPAPEATQQPEPVSLTQEEGTDDLRITALDSLELDLRQQAADALDTPVLTQYAPTDLVRVMVILEEPSLLEQGFTKAEISAGDAHATRAAASLRRSQEQLVTQIEALVSATADETPDVQTQYYYDTLLNGVSIRMPYGALAEVRALEGVESAFVIPAYSLPEDMTDEHVAEPAMAATQSSFGSVQAWAAGYTGEGMRIAIIDTGLDTDHPSFAAAPASPSLTVEEIDSVLTSLNAYTRYSQKSAVPLRASNLYRSEKVAFGFNYVDDDLDITHDNDYQGDHGTHVAGITAANALDNTNVVGVAPDAQLLIMKVFGKNGGAFFDDIVAALEDCFLLNVDAVNLSLGAPAGFSCCDDLTEFGALSDRVYAEITEHDMIAAIAAGNSGSAANGNPLGLNLDFASNPDNGIVSSPGTYPAATVVASLENSHLMMPYLTVGTESVPYNDVAAYAFTTLEGIQEYVMVPGYGEVSDYDGLDLWGKIAVVQRGELAFTDKQLNALNQGAIGCIVYDNVEGSLINMQDCEYYPNVFVTKASGAVLAAAADENGYGTLEVMPATAVLPVPSEQAGQLSDFSSWGVGSDLELLPDVTAPGGNIYSSIDGGQYGVMSGTSMATPHIAGMSALVLEYLHQNFPEESESWYHTVAEALIMSTAEPVAEPGGILYSPRKQGAGSANVYQAVSSPAYLTVAGDTPKVSFGDDDTKTGEYQFSFEINNLSDSDQTYRLSGTALTDQVQILNGIKYMGETSRELDGHFTFHVSTAALSVCDYNADGSFDLDDVQALLDAVNAAQTDVPAAYDLNGDGKVDTADVQALYQELLGTESSVVTVPAHASATVHVTLTLSGADKAYMDVNYENGIYVDGFVRCDAEQDGADLSLPFLGFYGDWSSAPIFDEDAWFYLDEPVVSRYWNVIWTQDGNYTLGENPYVTESYDPAHNVLSPNGDGYQDSISNLYLGMLRNAKQLVFTWKDDEGNVLMQTTSHFARKSYYISSYGICYPFIYNGSGDSPYYTFMNEDGTCAHEDLSRLSLTVEGWLDDGDMIVDDSFTIPLVIDNTAPEIDPDSLCYVSNAADGVERQIGFTVSDNYDIAGVVTLTTAGSIIETIPVNTRAADTDGETAFITLDVTKYDREFYVVVCDYGFNERYYQISFSGTHNIDPDAFYGYRNISVIPVNGYNYITTGYNGWHSFTDPSSMLMHSSALDSGETAVAAADYVDGYLIGIDSEGAIFATRNGEWTRNVFGSLAGYAQALDMAYDFSGNTMYVLTDEEYYGAGGHLLVLDILSGELTDLGIITGFGDAYNAQALTLACDNSGVLYSIDHATGDLYTIDPTPTEDGSILATRVGATGYTPQYGQSMTVDHETDRLYWAAYASTYGTSAFFEVDKETGTLLSTSEVQYNSEITGLFRPYLNSDDVIPDGNAVLTDVRLSSDTCSMATGTSTMLSASPAPYYAELGELRWSSNDSSVATVENGTVTALAAGTAVITATASNGAQASCTVEVIPVAADLTVYDAGSELVWRSFQANQPQQATVNGEAAQPSTQTDYFISAAYTNGTVYAYDTAGGFYHLDAETMQGPRLCINPAVNGTNGYMLALAYNYADGYFYGISSLVVGWDSSYQLVRVNPSNGEFREIATFESDIYGAPGNLAIDPEGNFYSVVDVLDTDTWESTTRILTYRVEDDTLTDLAFAADLQSFTTADSSGFTSLLYSYENECLFWADYYGCLRWIDPATGKNINLGTIGSSVGDMPMNLGLFELPQNEREAHAGTPEQLTLQESFLLLEGSTVSVRIGVEPWNSITELDYSIADESVATVSSLGVITGLAVGETTLTVTERNTGICLTSSVTVVPSAGNLYGNVVYDGNYGSNYWALLPDNAPEDLTVMGDFSLSRFAPYAGAYYDGCLYAFSHSDDDALEYKYFLLKIDLADNYSFENLGQVHENILDMAFDYTTGTMFAVISDGGATYALAQVNLETAAVTKIGDMGDIFATLTVDAEGQLYAISSAADLYRVDKTTGAVTLVGPTGASGAQTYQSMHYDFTTGNTYWSQIANDGTNGLYLVDLATGASTNLGSIFGIGASIACLYTASDKAPVIPDTVAPTGVALAAKQTVVAGEALTLQAAVLPYSVAAVDQTLTWHSSDTRIATVENGVVTGLSAGVVTITATTANGISADCTLTVTAEARRFYAYDESNRQWISFSADNTLDTRVERSDAEDEDCILASLYLDGRLYSFTEDGRFWSLDPVTFERTLIGNGCMGDKFETLLSDWWGNTELYELDLMPLSMAYDAVTGTAYVQFLAYENYYDAWWDETILSFYELVLAEIDLRTGEYEIVFHTESAQTNAMIVENGRFMFVDTFDSGMLSAVDLNAEVPARVQCALVYNYWGNANAGRGMLIDPLTDTVYIVRDMTDWGGDPSTLCTIELADADVTSLGLIGMDSSVVNSLFIR